MHTCSPTNSRSSSIGWKYCTRSWRSLRNPKVVVKEEVKELAIKSADVTKAAVITVTFNQNTDLTGATATLTKGSVKKDIKSVDPVATDALEITTDTKLTKGEYALVVTVAGKEYNATVNVAEDEYLKEFQISDYIIASKNDANYDGTEQYNDGIVYYAALNQYGEMMNASAPTATCSFSSTVSVHTTATKEKMGQIYVDNIQQILRIPNVEGTVVLVDSLGVNTTKTVKYSAESTPAEVKIAGFYSTTTSEFKDIKDGETISNYYLLLTAKDQYGYDCTADNFNKLISAGGNPTVIATVAGGLTEVSSDYSNKDQWKTVTVKGVDYIGLKLNNGTGEQYKTATAGKFTISIVNGRRGMLDTSEYNVAESTVIKSINITADNGVYLGQDNELGYEIMDQDGKAVTKYSTLISTVKFDDDNGATSGVRWEKKVDGSAKLIWNPTGKVSLSENKDTHSASTLGVITASVNKMTSGNFFIRTFSLTVNEKRVCKTAYGVKSDVTTQFAAGQTDSKDNSITIKAFEKLVYLDQYANKINDWEGIQNKVIQVVNSEGAIAKSGCSIFVESEAGIKVDIASGTGIMTFTSKSETAATATVYLKYYSSQDWAGGLWKYPATETYAASKDNYDAKFTVNTIATKEIDSTALKVDSVNDGYYVPVTTSAGLSKDTLKSYLKVVGIVGGVSTVIPKDQYVVKSIENGSISDTEYKNGTKEKDAKAIVTVSTYDSKHNEITTDIEASFKISAAPSKAYKVTGTDATTNAGSVSNGAITAGGLAGLFKFKDQYGQNEGLGDYTDTKLKDGLGGVTYEVAVLNVDTEAYYVVGSGTNDIKITGSLPSKTKIKVYATLGGVTKDVTVTLP
ncbi:MAG: hypothetical protein ACI4EE_07790 [Lachnospiraceae bacterium]